MPAPEGVGGSTILGSSRASTSQTSMPQTSLGVVGTVGEDVGAFERCCCVSELGDGTGCANNERHGSGEVAPARNSTSVFCDA